MGGLAAVVVFHGADAAVAALISFFLSPISFPRPRQRCPPRPSSAARDHSRLSPPPLAWLLVLPSFVPSAGIPHTLSALVEFISCFFCHFYLPCFPTVGDAILPLRLLKQRDRRKGVWLCLRYGLYCIHFCSSKFSLSPDPSQWGTNLSPEFAEADDDMHNPSDLTGGKASSSSFITMRGLTNLGCLVLLAVGIICLL